MKIYIKPAITIFLFILLASCQKDKEATASQPSIKNTSWQVTTTIVGNVETQNIFEFGSNGDSFSWHRAAADSYRGTWSQNGTTVNFTFRETFVGGEYFWDNTGSLNSDGATFTGTMQRRGQAASGTFTARKL